MDRIALIYKSTRSQILLAAAHLEAYNRSAGSHTFAYVALTAATSPRACCSRQGIINGNLRSKIVIAGLDFETGDLISRMIGQKTEVTPKASTTKRGGLLGGETSKTESDAEHAKRLLFYDDINALDWKQQICFFPYQRPLITERFTFTAGCEAATVAALGPELTHYPMPSEAVKPLSPKVVLPPVPGTDLKGAADTAE